MPLSCETAFRLVAIYRSVGIILDSFADLIMYLAELEVVEVVFDVF